jgi:serine/threonine-protein kinase
MLKSGDKVAHYTVEKLLGSGGMGEVYLALDERLHRKVALKIMARSEGEEQSKESAARLLREARAAASLTHPNVVAVFDVGESGGRVFLAMEYVVGKTLRELLVERDIGWQRKLRWLVDAARALGAAHRSGLVHRDIKPENVMVRDDGLVKVLDFGIARRTGASGVDPTAKTEVAPVDIGTLTGKGLVVGTPMYMAPEQLKGGVPDPRTDQFAWGVMAFEVLAGERPWPTKSDLLAAVATILTEPPDTLRKRAPEVPPAIESAIARTLSRDPEQRFADMDEVADALEPLAIRLSSAEHMALTQRSRDSKPALATLESATDGGDTAPSRISGDLPAERESGGAPITRQAMVTAKSPQHPNQPVQPPPRQKRRWHFLLGVGVALAGVAVWYKLRKPPVTVVPPPPPSASSSTTLVPAPPPVAPEALAAYQEGMQLWRDGSPSRARTRLEHATDIDSGYASAHLLLALILVHSDASVARARFQDAFSHRAKLSPSEAVLLDAVEPLFRASADANEAETRLASFVGDKGKDVIGLFMLGFVRESRSEFEKAKEAFERAIAADAGFIPAWKAKGDVERLMGNADAALALYDQCLKKSPAAAICLEQRLLVRRDRGDCEGMEKDARAWQSVDEDAADPSYYVAAALQSRAQPQASVEIALRRQWEAMPQEDRPAGEAEDRANLAILAGDFVLAERYTRAWDLARTRPEVMLHAGPQHQLALLAYEAGDVNGAGKIAADFLAVAPAMNLDPLGTDPTVWALEYLYRAGKLKKEDLDAKRKAWITAQEAHRSAEENRRMAPFRWAMVHAGFAETLEEAREAVDALPAFLPFPPDSRRTPAFDAEVGKTFALAGRFDEAVPLLSSVTRACIALGSPQLQTRAYYFLGMALEGKGDLEGAKRAYQVVVDRWGNAKPRSVTAEKARQRIQQLQ